MTEKKLSRKELELEQRKAYILDRAEELFAERGFENTSMAEIAEKSEFSVGSVYNFFPSKQDLLSEISFRKIQIMYNRMTEIDRSDLNPLEKIRESLQFHINFYLDNAKFVKIYHDDFNRLEWGLPTNFQQRELDLILKTHILATKSMRQAQEQGLIIKKYNVDRLVNIIRQIALAFHKSYAQEGKLEDMRNAVDDIIDIFLNGVGVKK